MEGKEGMGGGIENYWLETIRVKSPLDSEYISNCPFDEMFVPLCHA